MYIMEQKKNKDYFKCVARKGVPPQVYHTVYIMEQLKVRKKEKMFYNDACEHDMVLNAPGTF